MVARRGVGCGAVRVAFVVQKYKKLFKVVPWRGCFPLGACGGSVAVACGTRGMTTWGGLPQCKVSAK